MSLSPERESMELRGSAEGGGMSAPCPFLGHKNYEPVEEHAWPCVGQVWLARRVQEGDLVLIKLIERGPSVSSYLRSELVLHSRCAGHPYILQLRDVFLTDVHLALVLEYATEGDVAQLVLREGALAEPRARALFRQMLAATATLHAMGASKREARLECKLLAREGGELVVKVQDFAYSKTEQINSDPNSALGSLPYTAPEVLNNTATEGEPVDVWGLGVSLYRMATGRFPFESAATPAAGAPSSVPTRDGMQRVLSRIASAEYDAPAGASPELRELLGGMLERLPARRAALAEVAAHPWVVAGGAGAFAPPPVAAPRWSERELQALVDEASRRAHLGHSDLEALADEVLDEEEMDDLLDELELDEEGQLLSAAMDDEQAAHEYDDEGQAAELAPPHALA
ncbi:hypothetical protein QBZ16_003139 [Prototheca wickerhamii]|uniref:Protein kinase domain-containing protein n=1 Tax=Prototheca wickerhamii TaxID=3111 RepID=A0AAD9IN68_PROWI|nr:hypothetical protein QBZ16_003139 [Prototheca wickerhamii]